jgi:hypothetical protein
VTVRKFASFAALFLAFTLGARLGWWSVVAIAGFWGALRPAYARPAAAAGWAAAGAWVLWMTLDALGSHGAFGTLATRLGGVMALPIPALYLMTVLFPALLAWSASALTGGFVALLASPSGETR